MRIAIIGIKAIPAHYGGFETAVDEVSRGLVNRGHEVTVYNRTGMSKYPEKDYAGVHLVTLPTIKTKHLSTIAHSFVSTLHATDVLDRFGLKPREYVLFVGRLVPENNIQQLIRAFEQVETRKRLVIVGDDPWERDYVRRLKSTRDSRILFTGGVYGEGYAQLQQNAYMFVLPDEVGGTHPVLVEAMGFANCVLVNDTPTNLEVIGDSGISYRGAEGPEDLSRKLQILLEHPDLVAQCREKALRRAQDHYRWEDVIQKHEQLYRRALDRNGKVRLPDLHESQVTVGEKSFNRTLEFSPNWQDPFQVGMKRMLEVIASAILLIALSPLLLV